MTLCACNGLFNSGAVNSKKALKQAAILVFVHKFDENGNRNKIAAADIVPGGIDQTYIDGKLENTDPLARWYPIGPFINANDLREDSTMEEYDDGSRSKVRQGRRTYTGHLLDYAPVYAERVDYWACQSGFGVFYIDNCGNIIGHVTDDSGDLYPLPMNASSLDVIVRQTTNTEKGKIQVMLDFDQLLIDSSQRQISKSGQADSVITADTLNITGLIDTKAEITTPATVTSVSLKITRAMGDELREVLVTGLVLADFTLYNNTTASSITITSVTEVSNGVYDFVFPSQTSADVLEASFIAGGKILEPFTITIP